MTLEYLPPVILAACLFIVVLIGLWLLAIGSAVYRSYGLSETKRLHRVAEALGIRGATQKRLALVKALLGQHKR